MGGWEGRPLPLGAEYGKRNMGWASAPTDIFGVEVFAGNPGMKEQGSGPGWGILEGILHRLTSTALSDLKGL